MNQDAVDDLIRHSRDYPLMEQFGYQVEELREGFCRMLAPRNPEHDGIFKSFHGGLLSTAADTAACFAALTVLPPGSLVTTIDIHVRYVRPCLSDCHAEARVIKPGRTLIPVTCELRDDSGTLCAVAQVGYMKVDKPSS